MAQDTNANRQTLNAEEFVDSQPKLVSQEASRPNLDLGQPLQITTDPVSIPRRMSGSPLANSPTRSLGSLGLPSPIITKRSRTPSTYERALDNPIEKGKIKYFCRTRGHGFIVNDRDGQDVFVHVSDIDGEYVPLEGDIVAYRLCPIPPKLEKFQAIHCNIIHFAPDIHKRWDAPVEETEKVEADAGHKPNNLVT